MPRVSKTNQPVAPIVERKSRTLPVIVVLSILLVGALSVAGYFYYQYQHTPEKINAQEIADLVKTIGAVLELPTGETPTLATVSDKSKLENQPFFKNAENGDKVLIFADAGKAVLYRPGTKKIIDVTSVSLNTQKDTNATPNTNQSVPASTPTDTTSTPAATPEPAHPTVALYNGSTTIGVTNTLEDKIKAKFPDVVVATKDKATKKDYQGTLIVDVSGKNADLAQKLADSLGGTVGTLPVGETAPINADILVIVGNK